VKQQCKHQEQFRELQCAPGYSGSLCGVYAEGYAAVKPFTCNKCMNKSAILALYIVAAVVLLAFKKMLVALTLAANKASAGAGSCEPGLLLRPLLLYTQYALIISNLSIDFPSAVTVPLKAFAWFWAPASPQALSIDCLLLGYSNSAAAIPLAMQRVLVYVFIPLAMLVALLLLEAMILKLSKAPSFRAGMSDRLFSSAFVAAFFFLPSVARSTFSLFACLPTDAPASPPFVTAAVGSFWSLDLNMQCWVGVHRAFALGLGLPLLLLVCVGLPACILYRTITHRHNLAAPHITRHYGFLFRAYRDEYCWWEGAVALQTQVLVAVGVFGHSLGPMYQVLVVNATLAVMTVLLMVARPHAHAAAYRVMLLAMWCLVVTSYIAMSFIPSDGFKPGSVYSTLMGCVLLLMNGVFVLSVIWQLYRQFRWKAFSGACRRVAVGAAAWSAAVLLRTASSCCTNLRGCLTLQGLAEQQFRYKDPMRGGQQQPGMP
jgi:hypothetical protein